MASMLLVATVVVLEFTAGPTEGALIIDRITAYLSQSSAENDRPNITVNDSSSAVAQVELVINPRVAKAETDVRCVVSHGRDVILNFHFNRPAPKTRYRRWMSRTISTLQSTTSNLQSRSVCPWTYSYNNDPTRQPPTLIQAQCNFTTVPGTTTQCEHVYSFIPVKVTDSTTGVVSDQWLKLKVGCTLATPPVVNTPPITIN